MFVEDYVGRKALPTRRGTTSGATPSSTSTRAIIGEHLPSGARKVRVIVPAYNEAASVADTIRSLRSQTYPVAEIVVVDDCSSDRTAAVALAHGATVTRPPRNTGSKAGAQNFALSGFDTEFTMAIDADTALEPDAVERLIAAFDDPTVAAACGFVVPRFVRSIWERGRYIEYLIAFTWYKRLQDYYGRPLISSGCFSMYRTEALRAAGGWSARTLAEDIDLTWTLYRRGWAVRFVPDAVCYPIEPSSFGLMRKQLRRWSHGLIQNVQAHWPAMLEIPFLRSLVGVALWDATVASAAYLIAIPLLALFASPLFLLLYVIDLPAIIVPVLVSAVLRREVGLALASLPAFFVLRAVNSAFLLGARGAAELPRL